MEGMVMMNDFLKNTYGGKKVLLTGHTGFKGAWLLTWLQQLGAEIAGFALPPEQDDDLYNLINGDALCKSFIGDIRNSEELRSAVESFQPDFIFHLAAQSLVRRSYQSPSETFDVNVMGTVNLLEVLRGLQKECTIVIITTDKVYENREWHYPYRESDHLGGYDPYSASKAAAEIVVSSYRRSFFNTDTFNIHRKAIASARAGNVIGGGDRAKDRIIPDLVNALTNGKELTVRNPYSVRPWQHVLEPLSGYLLLGAKLKQEPARYADAWNFGPYIDDCLTVKELVDRAFAYWGKGSYITEPSVKKDLHEASLLKLDISKTIADLGWKPRFNSSQAIEQTLEWYRSASGGNALLLTQQQISKYNSFTDDVL
jgi:CDP-glucose 4,6-dehydratase